MHGATTPPAGSAPNTPYLASTLPRTATTSTPGTIGVGVDAAPPSPQPFVTLNSTLQRTSMLDGVKDAMGLGPGGVAAAPAAARQLLSQCQTFGHQCAASWQRVVLGGGWANGEGGGGAWDGPQSPRSPGPGAGGQGGGNEVTGAVPGTPVARLKSGAAAQPQGSQGGVDADKAAQQQQVPANPQAVLVSRGLQVSLRTVDLIAVAQHGSRWREGPSTSLAPFASHSLLCRGLLAAQVCVGLCAVCASEVRRTKDPETGRIVFAGQPMDIAVHVAAAGQAGMILVPQQTFRQLPVEVMSHDTLVSAGCAARALAARRSAGRGVTH